MKILPLGLVFVAAVAFGQIDEEPRHYTLNIGTKKIQRPHFIAAKAVQIRSADGRLSIDAGAVVEATDITLTLRGVRGEITLKASLGRLREVLDRLEAERRNP